MNPRFIFLFLENTFFLVASNWKRPNVSQQMNGYTTWRIHTLKYSSVAKGMNCQPHNDTDEFQKHYSELKKSGIKDHILYNSFHMMF